MTLSVSPSQIIFPYILPNQTYETTLLVRNIGQYATRLHIFQPTTPNFRLDYDIPESLAPGLSLKILVSFESAMAGNFSSSFRILSGGGGAGRRGGGGGGRERGEGEGGGDGGSGAKKGGGQGAGIGVVNGGVLGLGGAKGETGSELEVGLGTELTISLLAYSTKPSIQFEPSLSLGFLRVNSSKTETFSLFNEGRSSVNIDLICKSTPIDFFLTPQNLVLAPQTAKSVTLSLKTREAGLLQGKVEVVVGGEIVGNIEVSGFVVEFNRFVVDEEGVLAKKIEMGEVLFGEKREKRLSIVNNSPAVCVWKSVVMRKGGESRRGGRREEEGGRREEERGRREGVGGEGGGRREEEEREEERMAGKFVSPSQYATEELQKVIRCEPKNGVMAPYSQMNVKIECLARITERELVWVRHFALTKDNSRPELCESFEYVTSFVFENQDRKGLKEDSDEDAAPDTDTEINIEIKGKSVCPMIRPSIQIFNFGECPVNEKREVEFTILNKSRLDIEIRFEKVSSFFLMDSQNKKGGIVESGIVARGERRRGRSIIKRGGGENGEDFVDEGLFEGEVREEEEGGGFVLNSPRGRGEIGIAPIVETVGVGEAGGGIGKKSSKLEENCFTIEAMTERTLTFFYFPKNLGNVRAKFNLLLLNGLYKIPLKLLATTSSINNLTSLSPIKTMESSLLELTRTNPKTDQDPELFFYLQNKKRFDLFLSSCRMQRDAQKKLLQIKKDANYFNPKSEILPSLAKPEEEDLFSPGRSVAPMDNEFLYGEKRLSASPRLGLPKEKDKLYIEKRIMNLDPTKISAPQAFRPSSVAPLGKKFPSMPMNHMQIKDLGRKLEAKELVRVQAGPGLIDFGRMFVKSKMVRVFSVRNDMSLNIKAQLHDFPNELKQTYNLPQIIPSGETATFEIVMQSEKIQSFLGTISYTFNDCATFKFQVKAEIEPVHLDLDTKILKFTFADDNEDMTVIESINLKNNGNSPAKFSFDLSENKFFLPLQENGVVEPGSSHQIDIEFNPGKGGRRLDEEGSKDEEGRGKRKEEGGVGTRKDEGGGRGRRRDEEGGRKEEEEKMIIKIEDGEELMVRCSGVVGDTKVGFKDLTSIDLGEIQVSHRKELILPLKNMLRHTTAFSIDILSLPDGLEIFPLKGKLLPDELKNLKLIFKCGKEISIKDKELKFRIRGGKFLSLPFSVTTILPDLFIEENKIDFGQVATLGKPKDLFINLLNPSKISVTLLLDLRSAKNEDYDCLNFECLTSQVMSIIDEAEEMADYAPKGAESHDIQASASLLSSPTSGLQAKNLDLSNSDSEEGGGGEEEEEEEKSYFRIRLAPMQNVVFKLTFSPRDVKKYAFELPLELEGYGKLPGLKRFVLCQGLKPDLLLDPQLIDFKRKVISNDKFIAKTLEITMLNTSEAALPFFIDTAELETDKVFSITPSQGILPPFATLFLKASFNPLTQLEYHRKTYLYLYSKKPSTLPSSSPPFQPPSSPPLPSPSSLPPPFLELNFKGTGAYPRLLFDRREVCLPIVPVGVVSRTVLKVINDGFESLRIRHEVGKDMGGILEVKYPEGRNIGITKNKLRVEIVFISKKPFSFTTKIEFYDSDGRPYAIPVSATADNSIMTNFPYFLRTPIKEYELYQNEEEILMLKENVPEENISLSDSHAPTEFHTINSTSLPSSKSSNDLLLLSSSLSLAAKWLNFHLLSVPISHFPDDVIEANGEQIFELISFLIGKSLSFKAKFDIPLRRSEKVQILIGQYDNLLRFLMTNGALLSTVRPYYLLSYAEYCTFVKRKPVNYVGQSQQKLKLSKFKTIAAENWLNVYHQILKIFYVSRITPKSFKKQFPLGKALDNSIEKSNVYSQNEIILLKWLETIMENNQYQAFFNLNDFNILQNGFILGNLIEHYIKKSSIGFKKECQTQEDCIYNLDKALTMMKESGLDSYLNSEDFVYHSNARENILFLTALYQTLENFIPKKDPIVFSGILGDTVEKNIEIFNPINKLISYHVKLEGCSDFWIEEELLRLEPKEKVNFKVKFKSRVSNSVEAKLSFINKREGLHSAAALIFILKSDVFDRRSLETHTLQAQLYQTKQEILTIKNFFLESKPEYAEFLITLLVDKISKKGGGKEEVEGKNEEGGKRSKGGKRSNAGKNKKEVEMRKEGGKKKEEGREEEGGGGIEGGGGVRREGGGREEGGRREEDSLMPTFICSKDKEENYRCRVILNDLEVGEYQIEILAETVQPDPICELKPIVSGPIYVETPTRLEYNLPLRNETLFAARKYHEIRIQSGRGKESAAQINKLRMLNQVKEETRFMVEMLPAMSQISFPNSFVIRGGGKEEDERREEIGGGTGGEGGGVVQGGANRFSLDLLFKSAMNQHLQLIFRSLDGTDVRVYKLNINAIPRPVKGGLHLSCPWGEELKQELPLVNNSDRDWFIKATLNLPSTFHGPRELIVRKRGGGTYPLTFRPTAPLEHCEGKLTLINLTNNEVYEYDLYGEALEPLARGHLTLECKAKEQLVKYIEVTNPYKEKPINYLVETDLVNASGPSLFSIPPALSFKYPLTLNPLVGGTYTGSISFFEETDRSRMLWYTLTLKTERGEGGIREVEGDIRKNTLVEFVVGNPGLKDIEYEVIIDGEYLSGESYFSVPANSTSTYLLSFLPLQSFTTAAGSISFISDKIGETWYHLKLISNPRKPEKLKLMKAELGKNTFQTVLLDNPSSTEASVTWKGTNALNFSVKEEEIILPAMSETEVLIQYTPSDLDKIEQGQITFHSSQIGSWTFLVSGAGVLPRKFDTSHITCAVSKDCTQIVTFKNPMRESINVVLVLVENPKTDAFKLLAPKGRITIAGNAMYQIPYNFEPKDIRGYYCEITIHLSDRLFFTYPIIGLAEYILPPPPFQFLAKSREVLVSEIKLKLPGLTEEFIGQSFSLEMEKVQKNLETAVNRSFRLNVVKNVLNGVEDWLKWKVSYHPMKPIKTEIGMVVTGEKGGRWRFSIILEASEPDLDDTLQLFSPLHQTSSLSFKLCNRFKLYANFQAYFTHTSDPEFSIIPKQGVLEPYGKEGSLFIVSFAPVAYGKKRGGTLIIETEEIMFTYKVEGGLPNYTPPKGHSLIDTRLSNESLMRMNGSRSYAKVGKGLQNDLQNVLSPSSSSLMLRPFSLLPPPSSLLSPPSNHPHPSSLIKHISKNHHPSSALPSPSSSPPPPSSFHENIKKGRKSDDLQKKVVYSQLGLEKSQDNNTSQLSRVGDLSSILINDGNSYSQKGNEDSTKITAGEQSNRTSHGKHSKKERLD